MATSETNPRFTVIIPTKDRARYLEHTLRSCTHQDYDNLEIVVSDDGSVDDTRAVVEEAARRDPRVRYVTPGSGAGMLENFEFALRQVKPGYVMALGGDDGLMPHGITAMRDLLRASSHEVLAWPTPVFFYPGARGHESQVVLPMVRRKLGIGTRVVHSRDFLERQARNLSYVWDLESPMFYVKGVVSTRLVDQVKSRSASGSFYSCSTPDGYSGIVVAGEVRSWTFSEAPLSLHGISPTSAGFGYLASTPLMRKQSDAFFAQAVQRPLHRDLAAQPYSPLITIMTADFLLTVRDLPGWPGVAPRIDYQNLVVKALAELEDGLFARDRVSRELGILEGIAAHHGLGAFFHARLKRARRNNRTVLSGNAASTTRLYFDARQIGVENIVDASYFAYYAHRASAALKTTSVWGALTNSIRYRTLAWRRGESLTELWHGPGSHLADRG